MKLIVMAICSLIMLSFVLGFSGITWAEDSGQLNASTAIARMEREGLSQALNSIYESKKDWQTLLAGVGSGDEHWLKVAVQFKKAADAGASEQLDLAVGEALEHSPVNVFRIAFPAFTTEMVCGGPDIDDERYDSYDLAIGAINRRIRMVETTTEPTLKTYRLQCIKRLEASKVGIAHFYEIKR